MLASRCPHANPRKGACFFCLEAACQKRGAPRWWQVHPQESYPSVKTMVRCFEKAASELSAGTAISSQATNWAFEQ